MIQTEYSTVHGRLRVDAKLAAVMLADGKWYSVEDPTLPQGPDGYLSFLHPGTNGSKIMINVPQSEVKAASYYGTPIGGFEGWSG